MSGLSKYATADFTFDDYSPCFQSQCLGVGGRGKENLNNIDMRPFLKSHPDFLMAWKII